MKELSPSLTIREAATAHSCSERTIRRYIATKKIRAIQAGPGYAIRIDRQDWDRFLRLNLK